MLEKFCSWILRYPWLIAAFIIALISAAGYGVRFVHFKSDSRMFFNDQDPYLIAFNAMQKTYTKDDSILVVLSPKHGDVFTNDNLAIAEKLTQDLWLTPYSIRVDSITNFQFTQASGDDLEVKDLVRDADKLSAEDITMLRKTALNEPLLVNRLLSSNARVMGFNVTIQRPGIDQETETAKAVEFVRQLTRKLKTQHSDMEARMTGTVMLDATFAEASRLDLGTLTPAMLFIVAMALLLLLKSFTGTFAALTMMTFSIVAAVGLAGWMDIAFSPSSIPAPTILLTLAVADAVHILISYYSALNHGTNKQDAMKQSMLLNFKAIFFTNLTTAVGFLSMNFSDAPPFHDLGNITAMGVGATYLLTITFLPALMMLFPAKVVPQEESSISTINRLAAFVIRHRLILIGANTILVIFLTYAASFNELNDEFVKYFDESVEFRRDTDYTNQNLTGIYRIDYSLIQGEEGGINDPKYLNEVESFVKWYRQQPEVLHVYSITDILKRLNKNMNGDDPAYYRLPETREMNAQYLLMYEMSLPFGLDLNDRVNVKKSATRVTATLHDLSTVQALELEERAQAWLAKNTSFFKNSEGTGPIILFSHISERNIASMISGELVSMAIISFILIFVLRSVGLGLISLIPNLAPAAMAFGIWGLIVGQAGMSSSVVAAMTLGILVDDTVHFLSKYQYGRKNKNLQPEEALQYAFTAVGKALWVTSTVLILGFSLFAFSSFKINSDMGMLTAIIFALGLFAEFILLPPILLTFEDLKKQIHRLFARQS